MAAVLISIFLIGTSVIGIYCFLENYFLDLNRKMWHLWELRHSEDNQQTA